MSRCSNLLEKFEGLDKFEAYSSTRSLDKYAIEDSILKRMKSLFYVVKTEIKVSDEDTYFYVTFTVYDNDEAMWYGGIPSWKKWLKEDLGIDPKSVKGSKTRHLGSAGGFDYVMFINKEKKKTSEIVIPESLDGLFARDGIENRIADYLYYNPKAEKPLGWLSGRDYESAKIKYGDYFSTRLTKIKTRDLFKYAVEHGIYDPDNPKKKPNYKAIRK